MTVKQLSVYMENKPGNLAKVVNIISEAGVNIRAMSLADTSEFGLIRLIVSDIAKAKALLESFSLVSVNNVLAVEMNDRSGALSEILNLFEKEDINIEYMYAFTGKQTSAYVVMQVSDVAKAEQIFEKHNIVTIGDEDLSEMLK